MGSGCFVSITKENKNNTLIDSCIRFDVGNPSPEVFPMEDFKNAINIALETEGNNLFSYDEGLGSLSLRKCISKYLKNMEINSVPEKIQIISGAQQGIDIICKSIINYGDVVFVEEPSYNGALEIFKSIGCKIVQIPLLQDGIDLGILKTKLEKLRPKMLYIMPNFQNPTGISYSNEKKRKVLQLGKKYGFYIVEDDFLSDFKFNSTDNKPIKYYDNSENVIYIKSFSKILMPGLRIGFMDIPMHLIDKIINAKKTSDINTSSLVQKSLYYYMSNYDFNNHLTKLEGIYKKRFDKAKDLIENKLSRKLYLIKPSGGLNFFIKLPRGYNSEDFRNYLLRYGVCIQSGNVFFDNQVENRFFRINIASTNEEEIQRGIDIICKNIDGFFYNYKNIIDFRETNN